MTTFCMVIVPVGDGGVDRLPVVVQLAQLQPALRGEAVVLARRSGVGLLPLVVDEPFAPQLAQQRIERAFLRGELGAASRFSMSAT